MNNIKPPLVDNKPLLNNTLENNKIAHKKQNSFKDIKYFSIDREKVYFYDKQKNLVNFIYVDNRKIFLNKLSPNIKIKFMAILEKIKSMLRPVRLTNIINRVNTPIKKNSPKIIEDKNNSLKQENINEIIVDEDNNTQEPISLREPVNIVNIEKNKGNNLAMKEEPKKRGMRNHFSLHKLPRFSKKNTTIKPKKIDKNSKSSNPSKPSKSSKSSKSSIKNKYKHKQSNQSKPSIKNKYKHKHKQSNQSNQSNQSKQRKSIIKNKKSNPRKQINKKQKRIVNDEKKVNITEKGTKKNNYKFHKLPLKSLRNTFGKITKKISNTFTKKSL